MICFDITYLLYPCTSPLLLLFCLSLSVGAGTHDQGTKCFHLKRWVHMSNTINQSKSSSGKGVGV